MKGDIVKVMEGGDEGRYSERRYGRGGG
jgi:hypothetical protein